VTGLLIAATGAAMPTLWDGPVLVVAGMSVGAAGIGAAFVAASTTTLAQVTHQEVGLASGLLSTFHEFRAAIGVAVVSSIAAASIAGSSGTGFTRGFAFAAITAAVSAVLAMLVVPAMKLPAGAAAHTH
jgi:hypothetical protein